MIGEDFFRCNRAATAIEYGLIAALIAIALMGGLSLLGGGADGMWTRNASTLTDVISI